MRAIWKGALSFGLVNVPVRVYAATEEHDVRFHQVHGADGGRIRYRRSCSACGEEVGFGDIVKGYELPSGEVVVLTDEDFDELPLVTGHEIDVLEFVPSDQVDPILFARTYFLEPDATAAKPYVLLRQALESTDRMAIAKVALRQRETLAALRVRDGAILLQTMLWPDEVREADFAVLDADVTIRPQELAMASSLIESMSTDFDPTQYTDQYREALEGLIAAKAEGREVIEAPEEVGQRAGVVDLMTALQRSVDAARANRAAGSSGSADSPDGASRARARSGSRPAEPAAAKASSLTSPTSSRASSRPSASTSSTRSTRSTPGGSKTRATGSGASTPRSRAGGAPKDGAPSPDETGTTGGTPRRRSPRRSGRGAA